MTSQRHLSEEDASCPESFRTSRKRTAAMTQRENRHSKHQQEDNEIVPDEQAKSDGDSGKEKTPEMVIGRNLERNQTRQGHDQISTEPKVFNDLIHGHIDLPPLLVRIIDTPQFQRLRNIKQLGGAYFVFPGASHNRFEHSIGVAYLAGCLVKALRDKQPELGITEQDVLCVQTAGLCHDLGHGPFSHLFDRMFIPKVRPDLKWEHETASVQMFDHLVKVNNLEPVMEEYGLSLPTDLDFIKQQITGELDRPGNMYKGRPTEKEFLYEIVANKRTGIDVDKWDYIARDSYHLGVQTSLDHRSFIKFTRVCEVNGKNIICVSDKKVNDVYSMFNTRYSLHHRVYQDKVTTVIEEMISEALVKADPYVLIMGSTGQCRMSEAIDDMEAYTKLTDHVFEQILYSSNENLSEAQSILKNILCRRLYKCVGQTPPENAHPSKQKMVYELAESKPDGTEVELKPEDFVVSVFGLDFGKNKKNPLDQICYFYNNNNPTKAFQIPVNQVYKLLPDLLSEQHIRVYCKHSDKEKVEAAKKYFEQWCRNKNIIAQDAK